jgi:transcriptional regulator with XRE-family HTH domain
MGCAMSRSIGFLNKLSQGNLTHADELHPYPLEVDIKEWLVAARKHGEFTQEEIGGIVGCTKSNVSGWENGHHEPSFGQMVRISHATKFPIPMAGYKPRKAFSPYATALAELVDRQPEDDRQACATIAKRAIDQHVKEARKARATAKEASSSHSRRPTPTPQPR